MTDTKVPDQKQLTTTMATLALAGVTVNELAAGAYLVGSSRWCQSRYVPTFADLVALSRQMTEVKP
jgi:hypothetical protein